MGAYHTEEIVVVIFTRYSTASIMLAFTVIVIQWYNPILFIAYVLPIVKCLSHCDKCSVCLCTETDSTPCPKKIVPFFFLFIFLKKVPSFSDTLNICIDFMEG